MDRGGLVRRAQDGDEDAFRALYRSVHPGLLRYLRVLVGDQDADDIASETWLQLVRDLATFRGDDTDFRAFAARVGRNRAMDHLRRVRRRPAVQAPTEVFDELPTGADTAAAAAAGMSTDAALALIAKLPIDQAEAVLVRVVMGLDARSAGRVLGKRPGAVRIAAHRGLRRLAAILEAQQAGAGATGERRVPASGAGVPRTGLAAPDVGGGVTATGRAALKGTG
ncbi:MAG: RNA polymerase sigma factor [Micromonosporaceae bacterium]